MSDQQYYNELNLFKPIKESKEAWTPFAPSPVPSTRATPSPTLQNKITSTTTTPSSSSTSNSKSTANLVTPTVYNYTTPESQLISLSMNDTPSPTPAPAASASATVVSRLSPSPTPTPDTVKDVSSPLSLPFYPSTTPVPESGSSSNKSDTLSGVICIDSSDLYTSMLQTESLFVSPETYNPQASYLPFRRYLVDWMSDIGDTFGLHSVTTHVSVLYLDFIMRETFPVLIPPDRKSWQLIATACISVAAKYEEAEEHCPPIPELLEVTKLANQGVTPLSFRTGELEVLKYLFWTLRCHPALKFTNFFLVRSSCCLYMNDKWQGRGLIDKLPRYLRKYCEFYCNLCLQSYTFQAYLPSLLSSAIIMASRVALQVTPPWRKELELLTGYSEEMVTPVYKEVWKYYENQFPGHGSAGTNSVSPKSVVDGEGNENE